MKSLPIPHTPPLTYFEQRAAVTKAQAGDSSALQSLITSHYALIKRDATRFTQRTSEDYEDVISAGVLGFIEGIRRFDMSREERPYTYAVFYVRKAVQDDDDRSMGVTRTPRPKGRPRAAATDEAYKALRFHKVSLDAPVHENPQSGSAPRTLLDKIADESPHLDPELSDLLPRILALPSWSPQDLETINALTQTKGLTAAGREVGLSRQAFESRLKWLRPKLRSAILSLDPFGDITGVPA